jgi:integrase
MTHLTPTAPVVKPPKPYEDFPLFAHATGRWAKKVRGKLRYFGKWNDWQAALQLWKDQEEDLRAGRTPRGKGPGLTVADLCNQFLSSKKRRVQTGELVQRTWDDYFGTCRRLVAYFGKHRLVVDLVAADFDKLRSHLAENRGPVALGNEITKTRVVFRFALDQGLIPDPVRYGQSFRKPGRKVLLQARHERGPRMFEAPEIRAMLAAAKQPLKAMILLGVNCGFGPTDCSRLPQSALDLKGGWIDYPRPKTGQRRLVPLWPETVAALRESIATRPAPKKDAYGDLVFLTARGTPLGLHKDMGRGFREVVKSLGLHRAGLGLYTLRHVFETIGGDSRDQVAVDAIMGHSRGDMASVYRERISDERLRAVVDHVRNWVFGSKEPKTE